MVARRGDGVAPSAKRDNNSDGTRTRNPQIRSLIRAVRHGVVFVCVEEQGFEPGLSACKADALPLSYTPNCIGRWLRYLNISEVQ